MKADTSKGQGSLRKAARRVGAALWRPLWWWAGACHRFAVRLLRNERLVNLLGCLLLTHYMVMLAWEAMPAWTTGPLRFGVVLIAALPLWAIWMEVVSKAQLVYQHLAEQKRREEQMQEQMQKMLGPGLLGGLVMPSFGMPHIHYDKDPDSWKPPEQEDGDRLIEADWRGPDGEHEKLVFLVKPGGHALGFSGPVVNRPGEYTFRFDPNPEEPPIP